MSEADLPLEHSNQYGMDFMKNGDLMHCTAANSEHLFKSENKSKENSR